VVSISDQSHPLSEVSLDEDQISRYFAVDLAHKIFDTTQYDKDELYLSLSQTFDQYD
jgi:hypothetical protein